MLLYTIVTGAVKDAVTQHRTRRKLRSDLSDNIHISFNIELTINNKHERASSMNSFIFGIWTVKEGRKRDGSAKISFKDADD